MEKWFVCDEMVEITAICCCAYGREGETRGVVRERTKSDAFKILFQNTQNALFGEKRQKRACFGEMQVLNFVFSEKSVGFFET